MSNVLSPVEFLVGGFLWVDAESRIIYYWGQKPPGHKIIFHHISFTPLIIIITRPAFV